MAVTAPAFMSTRQWHYPPELLTVLEGFGLRPDARTAPSVVRDALNDLYRFELRRMRDRLRAGEIPKADYNDHVIALRKHYWPLTLPLAGWEKICDATRADPTARD
jgi:hypothetical protein